MKAIRFETTGGPEVLHYVDVELPPPGPGQARVKHTVIGGEFHRHLSPLRPLQAAPPPPPPPPPLPSGLGSEAAGVVESVGAGVTALNAGATASPMPARWAPMRRPTTSRPTGW